MLPTKQNIVTGLGYCLCMLRFVLYLVFSLNPQQDPRLNLLASLVGARILQLWAWGGVHKDWCLDVLEGSFALSLIILSGTTMYINVYVKDYTKQKENMHVNGYIPLSS